MDYQALLYDPVYLVQGVSATLALSAGPTLEGLTALDKTAGVDISVGGASAQDIVPAAVLRVRELGARSVEVTALPKATITFNGKRWNVRSYKLRPSPNGEKDGEVYLILSGGVEVVP